MKIVVIDNYDSFTYNLVHYLEKIMNSRPDVFRNDEIGIEDIRKYDKILISPGPGIPSEAGICLELISRWAPEKSILGICLGHQAICEAFGGKLLNLSTVYHGISAPVKIKVPEEPLFRNIPTVFMAGRYHSWVVSRKHLPGCFKITCEDNNGMIMGISHTGYDVRGLQFHPESVMTECGLEIIRNW
ncbi:MAG: anthranilate synthase component II, partial [Bacteroidales bacterium]